MGSKGYGHQELSGNQSSARSLKYLSYCSMRVSEMILVFAVYEGSFSQLLLDGIHSRLRLGWPSAEPRRKFLGSNGRVRGIPRYLRAHLKGYSVISSTAASK